MNMSNKKSPLTFFLLVYALTIPFWMAGALTNLQLLPGIPVSGFAFLCPVAAAAILIYRQKGSAGVSELLKRSFDFGRIKAKGWLVPLIIIQPGIMVLSYLVMRLTRVPLPLPQFLLLPALALFVGFIIGALGEELGWSGYAIDPLQERFGALRASLLIGVVWAVWHFIALLEVSRSWEFIAWWSLGTITARVIIVWLYNNTGRSVFVAAIFHALMNLTWQLFPVNGSFYDPRITGLITAVVAVIVVIVWGSHTLTRRKAAVS
jgi:membrane protease YdiL (CAAX protease family)